MASPGSDTETMSFANYLATGAFCGFRECLEDLLEAILPGPVITCTGEEQGTSSSEFASSLLSTNIAGACLVLSSVIFSEPLFSSRTWETLQSLAPITWKYAAVVCPIVALPSAAGFYICQGVLMFNGSSVNVHCTSFKRLTACIYMVSSVFLPLIPLTLDDSMYRPIRDGLSFGLFVLSTKLTMVVYDARFFITKMKSRRHSVVRVDNKKSHELVGGTAGPALLAMNGSRAWALFWGLASVWFAVSP
eukprot:TRINITY_DN67560_c0_g1_i1.p1 TRINITY_DN67560_c0_g1~~TRINITY_DN67560_c0_g1_i1.p1  ORF type:complete len:248 (-),score=19.64 TRINITY_DN67560_c0_g1_i1:135-878(-)